MPSKRKHNLAYRSEVSALYQRDFSFDPWRCAYCGDHRECLDHVPPLRMACDMDLSRFRKAGGELRLLPSCNECNMLLGSKWLATYDERLSALFWAYERKIKSRTWSQEELRQLGPGLRRHIEGKDAENRRLIAKFRGVERAIVEVEHHD